MVKESLFFFAFAVVLLFRTQAVQAQEVNGKYVELERKAYQQVVDGKEVDLFTLKNEQGMQVKITNYAGKIVQILVPDAKGQLGDVVQGFDSLEQTKNGAPYYGVTVGRYANRINKGQFRLEGQDYQLTINDGVNHLHGGTHGSAFVVFDAEQLDARTLKLNYVFKDGEEGYPGNCTLTVVYSLTDDNALQIKYEAVTDKPTVVNFTNHAFFNLSGEGHGTVLDNELMINADRFTVVDKTFIPTGELRDVKGTPMDFTTPMTIGSRIDADYDQLKLAPGYDHNYVLNKAANELSLAARIYDPASGRQMEVYTTEPGLQFYSGNFLTGKGKHVGKGGKPYGPHAAFCMETQHFPDSPNHLEFPSTQLNPDQTFASTTIYKFSVR